MKRFGVKHIDMKVYEEEAKKKRDSTSIQLYPNVTNASLQVNNTVILLYNSFDFQVEIF